MHPLLRRFVPIAIVIILLSGMIYTVSQQLLRQSANETPLALANDAVNHLSTGAAAASVVPTKTVDLAHDYAPFVTVLSSKQQVLASNVSLSNRIPVPPSGVFGYARDNRIDKITWQPENGVRIALIVEYYSGAHGGYVVSGQSLKTTEDQETALGQLCLAGWFLMEIAALLTIYVMDRLVPVKPIKKH